jgi:hypothetical protein
MKPHRQPFFSSDGVVEEQTPTPATPVPSEPRFGAYDVICIYACAGGAVWYVLYQAYQFLRWLLS